MSSVFASPAQVPARVGYFRANVLAGEGVVSQLILNEPLSFASATGFVANLGNIVQFNTYANAQTALTGGTTPNGTSLTTGDFLRDMGKTIHIEVVTNGISQRVASLTKAQKYGNNGETTEGALGTPLSTPAAGGKGYSTGYVVTWSANPDSLSGVPVAVTRVGY